MSIKKVSLLTEKSIKWDDGFKYYRSYVGSFYGGNYRSFRCRVKDEDNTPVADIYANIYKDPDDRYKHKIAISVCPLYKASNGNVISMRITHIGEYYTMYSTFQDMMSQLSRYILNHFTVTYTEDEKYPYDATYTSRDKEEEKNTLIWRVNLDGVEGTINYVGGGRDSILPFKYTINMHKNKGIIEMASNSTDIDIKESIWGAKQYVTEFDPYFQIKEA